jgi:hypothetical protein
MRGHPPQAPVSRRHYNSSGKGGMADKEPVQPHKRLGKTRVMGGQLRGTPQHDTYRLQWVPIDMHPMQLSQVQKPRTVVVPLS